MDYVSPKEVASNMMQTALHKASLSPKDLLIRGSLSGALLAISVALADAAAIQTKMPIIGALVFPVGFIIIVLLGLELVTGSFSLVPLACMEKKISISAMIKNLVLVFTGNLIGSVLFGVLFWVSTSAVSQAVAPGTIEQMIVATAEKKTIGYAHYGAAGLFCAFVKAILCNWMVCMGVVMAMTSKSTIGKIAATAMPIFIFYSLGYEHAVVNMFVIPTGILFGAKITIADWWLYNQLIVTVGNIIGGLLFTGMAIYYTYGKTKEEQAVNLEKAA